MSTACEELEGAALSLVRSGPIKERLAHAYRDHLARVSAEELPEELRADLRACQHALTRERPLRGEDAVRATVRKMSARDADELACRVLRLFAALLTECAREAAPRETVPNGAGVVLGGAEWLRRRATAGPEAGAAGELSQRRGGRLSRA